jgi:hypothetical protein
MAGTGGFQTLWLWGAGIIILGLLLAYAATRAGRLRPGERAQIDRNTEAVLRAHDAAERNAPAGNDIPVRTNRPYAILIPIVVVAFAIVLMIWSFAGTHGPSGPSSREATNGQQTTGNAATSNRQPAAAAPSTPSNDAASDSARGAQAPLNKSP